MHVSDLIEQAAEQDFAKPRQQWTDDETAKVKRRIQTIASSSFYGFDLNPDLVKVTKMNMFMNNDGNGNIYDNNSLLPPHEWESDLKRRLEEALHLPKQSIRNARLLGLFDVIVTNPPFGSKNPIRDSHILEQFDIGHLWHEDETAPFLSRWSRSTSVRGDAPPEQLFLERCLQFLKPGGRMAIVVPDSILGNPGLGYIREWLVEHTRIVASVDLHADTFQPHNGTQTSILIVQKKTDDDATAEQRRGAITPYNIFMAMVEKVGHDKRGNTVFKRDDDGNEIWEPEHPNVLEMGQDEEGNATAYTTASKTRIIDDQSQDVPGVFARWKHEEGIAW